MGRPRSAAQPHVDVPVGESVRRIRLAELPERVPGLLRHTPGRRVVNVMHEHDLAQACPGERIEDPAGHRPDRRRSYSAAARCHRGPVPDPAAERAGRPGEQRDIFAEDSGVSYPVKDRAVQDDSAVVLDFEVLAPFLVR